MTYFHPSLTLSQCPKLLRTLEELNHPHPMTATPWVLALLKEETLGAYLTASSGAVRFVRSLKNLITVIPFRSEYFDPSEHVQEQTQAQGTTLTATDPDAMRVGQVGQQVSVDNNIQCRKTNL